jgi:hypothetical protein
VELDGVVGEADDGEGEVDDDVEEEDVQGDVDDDEDDAGWLSVAAGDEATNGTSFGRRARALRVAGIKFGSNCGNNVVGDDSAMFLMGKGFENMRNASMSMLLAWWTKLRKAILFSSFSRWNSSMAV